MLSLATNSYYHIAIGLVGKGKQLGRKLILKLMHPKAPIINQGETADVRCHQKLCLSDMVTYLACVFHIIGHDHIAVVVSRGHLILPF